MQYSSLTCPWLPTLLPRAVLSCTSLWQESLFSSHLRVEGAFVPVSLTASEQVASRYHPGTSLATLISKNYPSPVSSNWELREAFYIS